MAGQSFNFNRADYFVDREGTIPAVDGDPVGCIKFWDQGQHTGFHIVSPVDASRPAQSEEVIAGLGDVIDI